MHQPLVHAATSTRVHLHGVAHFAPEQHMQIARLVQQLRPAAVVLEQPLTAASSGASSSSYLAAGVAARRAPLLPYPQFADALMGACDHLSPGPHHAGGGGDTAVTEQLREELLRGRVAARVGRDVLDPYECFG